MFKASNPKIDLYTMSPSTGHWNYAGSTNWSRTAKEAARKFKQLHPEQLVAAAVAGRSTLRLIRP